MCKAFWIFSSDPNLRSEPTTLSKCIYMYWERYSKMYPFCGRMRLQCHYSSKIRKMKLLGTLFKSFWANLQHKLNAKRSENLFKKETHIHKIMLQKNYHFKYIFLECVYILSYSTSATRKWRTRNGAINKRDNLFWFQFRFIFINSW